MTSYVANPPDDAAEPTEARHGLFRKQAVDKQQDRLLGDVLVVPPPVLFVNNPCYSDFRHCRRCAAGAGQLRPERNGAGFFSTRSGRDQGIRLDHRYSAPAVRTGPKPGG